MTIHGITIQEQALTAFCQLNSIRRLALFGSVIRDDFRPESDIDVLVEFESGVPVGLLRLAELEVELSDILGRRVDLSLASCLNPYFRDEVLQEARTLYVAA